MSWLRSTAGEVLGLFVDDTGFALAILVWLAAAWLGLPWLHLPPAAPPAILFGGLALILADSAVRGAGR
ncbi:MAG TPA: hypothetical protein VME92_21525 [Acetobacteraceae bacterium]|nr:hypothetical protein [Acetobacteraceae bacterium]